MPDCTTTLTVAPIRPAPRYVGVQPFALPGGLGQHEWADRRLVTALEHAAGGRVPLLVDTDGCVLEATWANVLIEEDGRLAAPPADGRLLPGIQRQTLVFIAEQEERRGAVCGTIACTLRCGRREETGQSARPRGPGASRRPYLDSSRGGCGATERRRSWDCKSL
jgi:hypothetical protein